MNVLSLFDGMSCGQIALQKLGIKVNNYFASEIDKYAIKVSYENFPNTIHLGDVSKIDFKSLPKIDLLIGGSPCQGFSFAGKQLNFNDPRSALFFEYVRALHETKPKYFLLENVVMKQEYQDVISEHLGVKPVFINSSLLSAQNRKRLYWTNLSIDPVDDKKIVLSDIIEHGLVDRDKSYCIDANYFKGTNLKQYLNKARRQIVFEKPHGFIKGGFSEKEKFPTIRPATKDNYAILDGFKFRKLSVLECKRLQTVPDDYKMNVSNSQAYKMLGNGWTVDVIVHILKGVRNDKQVQEGQESSLRSLGYTEDCSNFRL